MPTRSAPAKLLRTASPELATALRYVARQPILDRRGRVHGYELLFRSGPETAFRGDGELATRTMIDNTVMFGLEKLTGGSPAFVNCTAEILQGQQVRVLPPSMTVLEILETVEPTPDLIAACHKLKGAGYRLALDDFVWSPAMEPLLEIADYVKVEYIGSASAERHHLLDRLRRYPLALLAEKVETREEYEEACSEGFTLFQGYYFCRPTLLTQRTIPANNIFHIQLLRKLQQSPLDLAQITELVKRDPALTYRLLRLVNSPACAVRQEIRSIKAALMAVGDDTFRRIATLAIASELSPGKPDEVLHMAFARARFCELASVRCGFDATEQYLLGILSLLHVMLQAPLNELLSALPLRAEICSALRGEPGGVRGLLDWHESRERADWNHSEDVARSLRVDPDHLHACSAEALLWTESILAAGD